MVRLIMKILLLCVIDVLAIPSIEKLQEKFRSVEERSSREKRSGCRDKQRSCSVYKDYCNDASYINYLKTECRKTCNFCDQTCTDESDYCSYYTDYCKDTYYKSWIEANCAATCDKCNVQTTTPPLPTKPRTEVPIDQGDVECGKRAPGTRIVGGTMAKPGSWPWQVTMAYLPQNTIHWCGGSIVAPNWIVTASHCFAFGNDPKDYKIVAGQHTLNVSDSYEQVLDIEKIILHPDYSPSNSHDYDIALIKVKTTIKYNRRVRPVCLPKFDFDAGTECYISGWGHTAESGDIPMTLMQAKVPLVSRKTCNNGYSDLGYTISSRMRCAGFAAGGIDACQGDSGGPLVCEKGKKYYLMGAISWGVGCARKGRYGVYADLMDLKYWVQEMINKS